LGEGWTVLKLLRWTADYFNGRDIDSPRLDAELLLAETLGLDRVGLYLNFERRSRPGNWRPTANRYGGARAASRLPTFSAGPSSGRCRSRSHRRC